MKRFADHNEIDCLKTHTREVTCSFDLVQLIATRYTYEKVDNALHKVSCSQLSNHTYIHIYSTNTPIQYIYIYTYTYTYTYTYRYI